MITHPVISLPVRGRSIGLNATLLAGTAVLLATFDAGAAEAQSWWGQPSYTYQRPRPRLIPRRTNQPERQEQPRATSTSTNSRSKTGEASQATKVAAPVAAVSGPLLGVVSIGRQHFTIYDAHGPVMSGPISSGQPGHPTPTGVFHLLQKDRFHKSNIYSGAPMPFMHRLTWSGIAMHAGVLPGYPASHGCIRISYGQATKLFSMTKLGMMRVVVSPSDAAANEFSNRALPEPVMVAAAPGDTNRADAAPSNGLIRVAATGDDPSRATDAGTAHPRLLNPLQRAQINKVKLKQDSIEARAKSKSALEASQRASAEANAAVAALRQASAARSAAAARLDAARQAEQAATDDAKARAVEARQQAEASLAQADGALTEAQASETLKSRAAFAAAVASREADDAIEPLEQAGKVAERSTEPVAVFVSKREGKLYVRQGWLPIYETHVTFKEPNRPLGTHLYYAMAADDSTGHLSWTSVTVPTRGETPAPTRKGAAPTVVSNEPASSAAQALDRIEMPDEARRFIADRLWVGGSLIVSDFGQGPETGKDTDFAIVTR